MLDGHARTLMASYKRGYYMHSEFVFDSPGCKPRFFTPRECARLMGFPEGFRGLCGNNRSYHQLGNAVCPPVVAALGEALVRALELGAKGDVAVPAFIGSLMPASGSRGGSVWLIVLNEKMMPGREREPIRVLGGAGEGVLEGEGEEESQRPLQERGRKRGEGEEERAPLLDMARDAPLPGGGISHCGNPQQVSDRLMSSL